MKIQIEGDERRTYEIRHGQAVPKIGPYVQSFHEAREALRALGRELATALGIPKLLDYLSRRLK